MTPYILIIGYYHLGYLQWGKMEAADPFETSKYTTTPSRGTQIDTHRRHNTDVTTPDVTRSGLHNSDWRTFPPGSSGESDSCVGYWRKPSGLQLRVSGKKALGGGGIRIREGGINSRLEKTTWQEALWYVLVTKCYLGDKIRDCDGRSMWHGRFWWGNLKESDHLEKFVAEENIILKLIFKRKGGVKSGLILLWIRYRCWLVCILRSWELPHKLMNYQILKKDFTLRTRL